MSQLADVRSAWDSAILEHATLTALTDKIYNYDVNPESTKEFSLLRYDQKINFFRFLISRATKNLMMGQTLRIFEVRCIYSKQLTVDGSGYTDVTDALEVVQDLVETSLGPTWGDTVDYYRNQDTPPKMIQSRIENIPVWTGEYLFTGYQLTG